MKEIAKNTLFLFLILFFAALFLGRSFLKGDGDILYQVSTLDALMKGDYDGQVDFKTLKRHGNFGIGTLNGLDGEMVGFGHQFYQVKSDGRVCEVVDSARTPFSMVTFFDADRTIFLNELLDDGNLKAFIDGQLPTQNIPYAIKIEGKFDSVKARSIPLQIRPYRELIEAAKNQSVFDLKNVKGTMVGFRMPDYTQGINVAGYHWHFLSEDKKSGGHVLSCKIARGRIEIDDTFQLLMVLPKGGDFFQLDLSGERKGNNVEKRAR